MKRLVHFLVLAALSGCTTNNTYVVGDDGGMTRDAAGTCTASAKECVTSRVARICAADGTGWVSQQCDPGFVCSNGDCTPDPNAACNPGEGVCVDATHALRCNANGMGFAAVTCPSGTNCAGPGVCQGSCVVGSSMCLDPNTVATCNDGKVFSTSSCMRGTTACVQTGTTPYPTAACQPAECLPDPNGCDQVCGNKTAGASNTDPGYVSFCQQTAAGYKWAALQCPSPTTCDPTGTACTGLGLGRMATCASQCVPGAVRCAPSGLATQTCGTNGTWNPPMNCTATATGTIQVCVPGTGGNPVCGDPVCGAAPGACEADGFHPCVNGKVSSTKMACTTGTCIASGPSIANYTPGSCQSECQTGDQRCSGPVATSFQTCVNGLWSAKSMTCSTGTCQQFADSAGAPRTVCGVCVPGMHRCTNGTGTAVASGTDIETCDMTGQWGTHAACTLGSCLQINPNGDSACVAQCIPGAILCAGAQKVPVSNPQHPGSLAQVTCTANGTIPAAPTAAQCAGATPPASCCPGTTSCRKGPGGQPVQSTNTLAACVECVGDMIAGGNEVGLVDTRCPSGTTIEQCQSNNTWPTVPTMCGTAMSCMPESGNLQPSCGDCPGIPGTAPCDETTQGFGFCAAQGLGSPVPCGASADCCASACGVRPTPAFCQ